MHDVDREFSDELNREITYCDIPREDWERELKKKELPEHLAQHLLTMAELHRAGRYDRLADSVERVTGRRLASESLCPFPLISSAVISLNRLYAEQ